MECGTGFFGNLLQKKIAWMIEVTRGRGGIDSKIAEFARDYEPRIREQLVSDEVIPSEATGKWQIGFWAFVPEWDCERVTKLFERSGIRLFKVEPLDHALSLSAWDYRFPKFEIEALPKIDLFGITASCHRIPTPSTRSIGTTRIVVQSAMA
jgi:hypothetical protein